MTKIKNWHKKWCSTRWQWSRLFLSAVSVAWSLLYWRNTGWRRWCPWQEVLALPLAVLSHETMPTERLHMQWYWSERHTPVTTDTFSLFVFKMSTTYRCQKRPENFMVNLVGNSRSSHIQFQCWTIPESGYCPDSGIAQHRNGLRKKKMVWE